MNKPTAGSWFFIVARYDGSNISVRHYDTASHLGDKTAAHTSGMFDSDKLLLIGSASNPPNNTLGGRLESVAVYKGRALTDNECDALWNSGNGKTYTHLTAAEKADLLAWYNMDEASGTRVDSQNNYDLGPVNGPILSAAGIPSDRVTNFGYDFRDRQESITGEIDFYQETTYDNLDRVTFVERRDTSAGGNLIAKNETKYDDRGRVYQTITYEVDPSDGSIGNSLTDNTWYDGNSNVIKSQPSGSDAFTKTTYDGLSRPMASYTGYFNGLGIDDPATLTNNKIFEQVNTTYDEASNVTESVSLSRYHDATSTGALTAGTDARPQYTATWQDGVGRTIAQAAYGNQGNDATAFTRPTSPPDSSDTVLVSTLTYNSGGAVSSTIDPAGVENHVEYDSAGRTIRTIVNYQTGAAAAADDANVTTETTYNLDGNTATLIAKNPDTGDQTTYYVYGVSADDGSDLATSGLLRATIYPDSADGADQVSYTYNRQGQPITVTDQNGTVHAFDYDLLGRAIHDRITTVGSGVDSSILRTSTTYEVRGMVETVTSYDNATVSLGAAVNQVEFEYNDFEQLTSEHQNHTGSGGTPPKVDYTYATGANNTIRRKTMVYPDSSGSRTVTYTYDVGNDDKLSRVSSLAFTGSNRVEYTYSGLDGVVKVNYPQPGASMTLADGSSSTGFDRFDRVVDVPWTKTTPADLAQLKYGYDRASNRTYRQDVKAATKFDELYSYDELNRLKSASRGTLDFDTINGNRITSPTFGQGWDLDATGNWSRFNQFNDQETSFTALDQQRTSNAANEITTIAETTGDRWISPVHDRNGNMTTMPQPAALTAGFNGKYDAWNRLAQVTQTSGGAIVADYQYDGLGRRISIAASGTTRDFYYSDQWQVLEERVSGTAVRQFVWGNRYVDDLVLRDRSSGGTLNERLYALQDANWNIVAIVGDDSGWKVLQRFAYDPYGSATELKPNFSTPYSGTVYEWEYTYTSRILDDETGLMYYRARYYHAELGRFIGRDPIGYMDGMNLFAYVSNRPINEVDPSGSEIKFTGGTKEQRQKLQKILSAAKENASAALRKRLTELENHPDICTFEIVQNSKTILMGSFNTGQLDIVDIEMFPQKGHGLTQQSIVVHEVIEQWEKQVRDIQAYPIAHAEAVRQDAGVAGNVRQKMLPVRHIGNVDIVPILFKRDERVTLKDGSSVRRETQTVQEIWMVDGIIKGVKERVVETIDSDKVTPPPRVRP